MKIEKLLKEFDDKFQQKTEYYGYYGWIPETKLQTVREWVAKNLQKCPWSFSPQSKTHLWQRFYSMEKKVNYWMCLNCGDKSKTYTNPISCGCHVCPNSKNDI